ncbi:alpha/beta hydrolase [Sansalvadorimonas sp. 2012CJ34-2]|uniref:Alpha/beta hydrolase n=1 Tax=Parendozoicomonas callyspongiae TaxID=2942213 RepID=A0ABT0PKP3_9GAMM|nr:alpha/beta family hydrolase [Sansalvadorimonas sp. 2012CJ34-2]MCL6271018.1 alpha/beta hydrolase [Sansalvadorimonas sp. 2012CJ34-2]
MDKYLWNRSEQERAILILAHGAGAPMDHAFLNEVAELFAEQGITVVRFEFPYMAERRTTGKKRPPDRAQKLLTCWQEVIADIQSQIDDVPLYIGGKSMGGRMATLLAAEEKLAGIKGVVCLGYPFYAIGKPEKPRTEHLESIGVPVLIAQGERDAMGNREAVKEYSLSESIEVHWLEDGNHDLKPRKASNWTHQQHLFTVVQVVLNWIES